MLPSATGVRIEQWQSVNSGAALYPESSPSCEAHLGKATLAPSFSHMQMVERSGNHFAGAARVIWERLWITHGISLLFSKHYNHPSDLWLDKSTVCSFLSWLWQCLNIDVIVWVWNVPQSLRLQCTEITGLWRLWPHRWINCWRIHTCTVVRWWHQCVDEIHLEGTSHWAFP